LDRVAQFGIALGALGLLLLIMGLFPGITGRTPTLNVGVVQLAAMLIGWSLMTFGALIYAKFTYFAKVQSNLTQQIGSRLALTGIVFAAICGLADVLGFGSNAGVLANDVVIGQFQIAGIIGSFVLSSLGVILFAIGNEPR
jgi:hypothetical protein